MIDADLARIYGTTTKRLNEQVKRNAVRFPNDFMFKLTPEEALEVVAICDHLKNLKYSSTLPYVFTEHGALMLANVLSSDVAVRASLEVVRAFVSLREMIHLSHEFSKKFEGIEKKFLEHDAKLRTLFDAIRQIMAPLKSRDRRPLGIRIKSDDP